MEFTKDTQKSLWINGWLDWKMHRGQWAIEKKFRSSVGKLFVLDISRQFGKSTWLAKIAIETAIREKNSRIRVGAAFLTDVEQFIIPAFEFLLEDCPEEIRPKWNAQKYEWTFHNGSKIRLVGLDRKPNGLRGNKLRLIILDEAGYISHLDNLYRLVLIPCTTHVPTAKIILSSTQPESPDHDFCKFCDIAESKGNYFKATIYDNPLLSLEQIASLAEEVGGFQSTAFKREYLCMRVVEESRAIIPDFDITRHVKETLPDKYWPYWIRMESLDSGVRDKTACLFGYYDFHRAKAVIEYEFAIQGAEVTTRRIAEEVKNIETTHLEYEMSTIKRVADNDNLILIQDLGTEHQLFFTPTDKDNLHAMVNKVRIWFQTGRIEIHPRCKMLIGALMAGIWDKNRKEFERSALHGHFDMIAALVYFIRNVPETVNRIPEFFGLNLSDTILREDKIPKTGAEVFKRAFLKGN